MSDKSEQIEELNKLEQEVNDIVKKYNGIANSIKHNKRLGKAFATFNAYFGYYQNEDTGQYEVVEEHDENTVLGTYETEELAKEAVEKFELEFECPDIDDITPYASIYKPNAAGWFPSGINC